MVSVLTGKTILQLNALRPKCCRPFMAQFTDRLSDRKSAKQLGAKGDTDDGSDILKFETLPGALGEISHDGDGFAFDCEGLGTTFFSSRFDWLTAWSRTKNGWNSLSMAATAARCFGSPKAGRRFSSKAGQPLYWEERDGEYWTMTLRGGH